MPIQPMALSQLPSQAIHAHFATRPRLFSVLFKALRTGLLEHYPDLKPDLLTLKLASPTVTGSYAFPLLVNVAIAHVLNPQLLDLQPRGEMPYYLSPAPGSGLADIDMQVVARIIDELPGSLYLHWQQDLADYWSALDSHGSSRWQWLGEFLQGQMSAAATRPSTLSDAQRDMLATAATWPVSRERLPRSTPATYAYFIETTLSRAGNEQRLLTPDLLLVRDRQVLLCSVSGAVESFDCLDAFGETWGTRMQARFQFDSLTWRRNEPDGNVFEQQAGLILNQQLEDLASVSFQGQGEEVLTRTLDKLTDPAVLFTQLPEAPAAQLQEIDHQLPGWLKQAKADDRFAYHRHLQDMAQVLKNNQGRSFNEGIENIHTFSRDALRTQMQTDHGDYDPDDLMLDFAVAAGYPGTTGIIDHVRLSLTELALKNLAGKPKGTLTLSSKSTATLPAWLSEDYLLGSHGLIQRVDIGTSYPEKIKELLLSDTVEARRREHLFTTELKVHLPMLALEYAIRQQYGVTTTGYRYVKALMSENPADRVVDDQEIVLRPLALCRKTGAAPDTVNNFFIIEPRDVGTGPHLLYRPLYTDALYQYPTRQALLNALAAPGELQTSVLTWLSDRARPVYDHGGFTEPHIIRFLPGDEFAPPEQPLPASLAVDEGAEEWLQSQINGQLPNHLFGSTARALVDLADRASVSNSESRWAIVMEGAWLLFNTLLLPLARGPAMLSGWLLVLVSSLEQDLAGLQSTDPTTRELALIDLLLNTAMVLLHAATPAHRPQQALAELAPPDNALHLSSWRRPAGQPPQAGVPLVRHGPVALPGEPPATGHTALDFSRSIATPQAGARLLKALLDVHVPWPETLPPPEASGALKGLYRIGATWHASLGGLLFQVSVVPGFAEVYLVDPKHPLRPGFKLAGDAQGHWRLERKARLAGGMPREKLDKWQREHRDQLKALKNDLDRLNAAFLPFAMSSMSFERAQSFARNQWVEQLRGLHEDWLRLGTSAQIPQLHSRIATRHEQRRLSSIQARIAWNIAIENNQKNAEAAYAVMQQIEAKAGELMHADRTDPTHSSTRNNATKMLYNYWAAVFEVMSQRLSDTYYAEHGETDSELHERVNSELPRNITDAYEAYIHLKKLQLEALKHMVEPAQRIETYLKNADPVLRQLLLRENPSDQTISSTTFKLQSLILLTELILNRTHPSREAAEHPFITDLTDPKNITCVLAHTELSTTRGYSTAEQIDVLKGVLERYERLENAVNSLTEMGSGFIREEYRTTFLEQLVADRADLEAHLADVILIEEGFIDVPRLPSALRKKPANRTVIKTRSKHTLVGDLRPPQADMPGNFVEIKDPITGQTLATYLEHAEEGDWVEVVQAAPVIPPKAAVVRSLNTIKRSADTVIAQKPGIVNTIRTEQRKLRDPTRRETLTPLDWDDMLTQQASRVDALADEIQRDHGTDPKAGALADTYRKEANDLRTLAHQVCAEGYLQQRPQAYKVAYLFKHGFIDINLAERRAPLKTGDFIDKYTVRDKSKIAAGVPYKDTLLWHAHFHYPLIDTDVLHSSFGHLKTTQEEPFTRRELIEQAQADNRALIYLEKAVIRPPLDYDLFLKLAVEPENRQAALPE